MHPPSLGSIYSELSVRASTAAATSIPTDLTSTTFYPGVYVSNGQYLTLNGMITFDAQGASNSVFIIIAPGTGYLSVSPGSAMMLANGALASNVIWVSVWLSFSIPSTVFRMNHFCFRRFLVPTLRLIRVRPALGPSFPRATRHLRAQLLLAQCCHCMLLSHSHSPLCGCPPLPRFCRPVPFTIPLSTCYLLAPSL